jgi:ParB-like chromosome segregation protein Spo0J
MNVTQTFRGGKNYVSIRDLILLDDTDVGNPNKHTEESVAQIAGGLSRFAQQKPIVVRVDGVVLAGNGVVMAAKSLGWTELWAEVTSLDGEEALAYSVSDNETAKHSILDVRWVKDTLGDHLRSTSIDGLGLEAELVDEIASNVDLDLGGEDGDVEFASPITMTRDQRDIFERALATMRSMEGDNLTEGRCVELLSADWLSGVDIEYP